MQTFRFVVQQNIPNTLTYKVISPTRNNFAAVNIVSRDDIWQAVGADVLQEKVEAKKRAANEKAKKKAELEAARAEDEKRLRQAQDTQAQKAKEELLKQENYVYDMGDIQDPKKVEELRKKEEAFAALIKQGLTPSAVYAAYDVPEQGVEVSPKNVILVKTASNEDHKNRAISSYGTDWVVAPVTSGVVQENQRINTAISTSTGTVTRLAPGKITIKTDKPPEGYPAGDYYIDYTHTQANQGIVVGSTVQAGQVIGRQVDTQESSNYTGLHSDLKVYKIVNGKPVPIENQDEFATDAYREAGYLTGKKTSTNKIIRDSVLFDPTQTYSNYRETTLRAAPKRAWYDPRYWF